MSKYIISIVIGLLVGSAIGIECCDRYIRSKLDACQKQHNVYQCKMVAQPVEDGAIWFNKYERAYECTDCWDK